MKRKTLMSWSSGKDSAWALYQLQKDSNIELAGLFCTVNKEFDRVAMHGVRVELLQKQADSIGLPLEVIEIPYPCSNEQYEKAMGLFIEIAKDNGVEQIAFGDLFLEDIRGYRVEKLQSSGIEPIFPIWGIPTELLSRKMVDSGLRTIITCVDPRKLSKNFAGKEYTHDLLNQLPDGVDPCGENGEFHSFVFDGPMFNSPINIAVGEIVKRDEFVYADVMPV
ncbi:MAG: adenine nucleotide alpha hydrolase [Gammaproteobacteria bacterium]|nr:MAG: adenine nucleotide alpha hydrolase [Gammaproteobacteria bacterium]